MVLVLGPGFTTTIIKVCLREGDLESVLDNLYYFNTLFHNLQKK